MALLLNDRERALVADVERRRGAELLGLVLSGSAARGMATERSDLDLYVVLADRAGDDEAIKSAEIDEIPIGLAELEDVPTYGSHGWWFRWSFAYARVLRDDTGGRIADAVRRQATLDDDEQRTMLIDHDRIDGWVNFAYRSLKSDRDGRLLEARLDACESVLPWLMDLVFALAGRVRPYNKYLPWELREHPLAVPEWSAEAFLPEIERMLAGDPAALRRTFAVVDREARAWDAAHETSACGDMIDSWESELAVFDMASASGDASRLASP